MKQHVRVICSFNVHDAKARDVFVERVDTVNRIKNFRLRVRLFINIYLPSLSQKKGTITGLMKVNFGCCSTNQDTIIGSMIYYCHPSSTTWF